MALISNYEFSNSFRLNYSRNENQETYTLKIFKLLKKVSNKTVVREWELYDIKSEDIEKYFDDADFKYKLQELKVADLKEILKDHNLKSTGVKKDLLNRCSEYIPEEELKEYLSSVKLYKSNENARNFLEENEYLNILNNVSSEYLAYFLSNEKYMEPFNDVPKDEIKSKLLEYFSQYDLNGSLGEDLILLLAALDLYNSSEDLTNFLKTAIKIILIIINDSLSFTEIQDWRVVPLDENSNTFLEYSFSRIEHFLDGLNYLLNTCPQEDLLENIIKECNNEINSQIPNLNQENSIYYIVGSLLGKSLYSLLNEEIPENSIDCIDYFKIKQKVEYKRTFINYLKDVGRYIQYGPMDYTKKHFFKKSLDEGLIKLQKPLDTLDYYDYNELKDRLLSYNTPFFNSKDSYKTWIKEHLSEDEIRRSFSKKYYEPSEKGNEFIENNIHYTIYKSSFYEIFSLGLSDYEPAVLFNSYSDIDFDDYEPIIPLETYENEIGNLEGLINFINEKTLKEDIKNQMWYKYARDLGLLNNVYHINGSNENEITKNFLKSYLIKLNAWYREDQTNPDLTYGYNLHNYRYDEKYDEFFHEIYSTMEVPHLFFSEKESKEYMEYSHSSFDIREELKKRIQIYENGEENAPEPNYLGDNWIEDFISYKEFLGFDINKDSLHIYREEMCLDFQDETLKNKVDEFLIKLDNLISENKSHDEIKEELKEYTDLINVEGEKHAKELRDQRLNEERLKKRYWKLSDNARKLERRGENEEAIELYKAAIKLSEENPDLFHNTFYLYHRLLIICRKMKDYDKEMEVCETILSKYEKIIQKEGYGFFLTDDYDEKFIKEYKSLRLKTLKNDLKFEKEIDEARKRELKRLTDDINKGREMLEKFDENKDDIRRKNLIESRLSSLEEYLLHKKEVYEINSSGKEDLESKIENFDKDFVFNKEEIDFPANVSEYKKYQKRLKRIKQLKEKNK